MKVAPIGRLAFFPIFALGVLSAAPQLRLVNSAVVASTTVGGTAQSQTLEAYNIGDGALSLGVSVSPPVPWLSASVGAARACTTILHPTCIPLGFTFNTASLARGAYTAAVTVSDPQAIDSPQVVTVTVQVGSPLPQSVDQYVAPGTTKDISFPLTGATSCYASCPVMTVTTQDGGPWLALVLNAQGTLGFYYNAWIRLEPPAAMAPGTYSGSVAINNQPSR
jgi:hypothetical protein